MENGILTQTTEYTPYKGHCRKFFYVTQWRVILENCDHKHSLMCDLFDVTEDLNDIMNHVKLEILESSSTTCNREYQEDPLYDLEVKLKLTLYISKKYFLPKKSQKIKNSTKKHGRLTVYQTD